jgi:hypothetical protein
MSSSELALFFRPNKKAIARSNPYMLLLLYNSAQILHY